MGYVVNKRRFKQSGLPFLLPYSNKSKVITYLTVDNFNGSDSTTWGNDYTCSMYKSSGAWELTSDGKSVCVYNPSGETLSTTITAPNKTYNFTVYIVAQYSGDNLSLTVRSYSSPSYNASIFYDISGSSLNQLGSNFNNWTSGNYSYFNGTTAYSAFQAYGISYTRNARAIHILNDSAVVNFPRDGNSSYPWDFGFKQNNSTKHSEVYIKLLAIVSEAESSTVLQNNINYIRNQLHLT